MKRNTILENIEVEKLVFWWKWFAKLKSENTDLDWRTIFISWGVTPGSIVNVRVLKSRKDYIEAQCQEVIKKSPIEKQHPNNPYGKQAWIMWVNIPYEEQLKIKAWQVEESLFHVRKLQEDIEISPIVPSKIIDWYRNKVEFSFWKNISAKTWSNEHFNVGFHKQWEFSKIEDFDWTILIDDIQNTIYKEIKDFAKDTGLPVYDQFNNQGFFRHIMLRKTYFTDELMIIFSFNHEFEWYNEEVYKKLKDFFTDLSKKYSQIKSVYFSLNSGKADIAIAELEHIYGEKVIQESFMDLKFNISPKSFFQTNSSQAKVLYENVLNQINPSDLKDFTVLDLYGWTWTIWMVFAPHSKNVISVELVEQASKDWEKNAKMNNITNMSFVNAKVEDFLEKYTENGKTADLLVVDPPRAWMHPKALPNLLKFGTKNIIYVSCNPATLSRDLSYILQNSDYKIVNVTPVDMFPHTPHIETIVKLEKK